MPVASPQGHIAARRGRSRATGSIEQVDVFHVVTVGLAAVFGVAFVPPEGDALTSGFSWLVLGAAGIAMIAGLVSGIAPQSAGRSAMSLSTAAGG